VGEIIMTTTTFAASVITDGYEPIFNYAASGDGLLVNAGVTLANNGVWVVYARGEPDQDGLRDLTAIINGTISGGRSAPLDAFLSSIDVTVGATGRLETSGGVTAIQASYDSTVANRGSLHASQGFGVTLNYITSSALENWGTIFGEAGAVSFHSYSDGSSASLINHGWLEAGGASHQAYGWGRDQAVYSGVETTTIVNEGTMLAADRGGAGVMLEGLTATIENSGTIHSERYWGVFVQGTTALDMMNGGTISGKRGAVSLSMAADTVTNDGHLDGRVTLGRGGDVYHGENGRVTGAVWGQGGNDLLMGGDFADILGGGSGQDTIFGGGGADTLTGSTRADVVSGGAGNDLFRFATAPESVGDTIVASDETRAFEGAGAAGGDRIDVSSIDANWSLAGNQAFVFGSSHELGRLWAVDVGDVTHIRGNINGDAAPEFDLAIDDGAGVHASDYAAIDFIL
jgi:Ca2+-binding RTX toxin-like protein